MTPDPFIPWLVAILWVGLGVFTVGLAILLYTRWGQYKPLRKCMAMSLLAHLLMAGYAATVQIVTPIAAEPAEQLIHVSLGDGPVEKAPAGGAAPLSSKSRDQPWETFPPRERASEPFIRVFVEPSC